MGIRYQKRVNLGKGVGLNVSKSGVSASVRSKYGSIGPKGFSIRTGIPGLTYRGGKNSNVSGIFFIISVAVLFIGWVVRELYHFILRRKMDLRNEEKAVNNNNMNFQGDGDDSQVS